jgi:hypothetical protein
MAGKICFRGDTRTPQAPDAMFATGFLRRQPGLGPIVYRTPTANAAGDIDPPTAVCVSARLVGAVMFPLRFTVADPAVSDTWIYMVSVDSADIFNTHKEQVLSGLQGVGAGNSANRALWPLFAHELCALRIPAGNIIGAVRCTRTWLGPAWTAGANYQLHAPIIWNGGCNVAAELHSAAVNFLQDEVDNHANGTTPTMASGYHASTGT